MTGKLSTARVGPSMRCTVKKDPLKVSLVSTSQHSTFAVFGLCGAVCMLMILQEWSLLKDSANLSDTGFRHLEVDDD